MDLKRYPPDDPREWLRRAQSSLHHAHSRAEGVAFEGLCYDAQQSAEKAIKAVMIARNVRFPYVHDLDELQNVLERAGYAVPTEVRSAHELTRHASEFRYPTSIEADETMYARAIEVAQNVVAWALGDVASAIAGSDTVREPLPAPYAPWPAENGGRGPDAAVIDELVARIVASCNPERIILFGSAARGTMGPHSDLDVMVVKSGPYDHFELSDTIRNAIRRPDYSIDLVLVTPDDLERYGHSWALVYRPALEEGRVVYDAAQDA